MGAFLAQVIGLEKASNKSKFLPSSDKHYLNKSRITGVSSFCVGGSSSVSVDPLWMTQTNSYSACVGSRLGCRSFTLLEVLTNVCCGGSSLLLSSCSSWNTFRRLSFVSCIFCFVYGTWNEITTICGEHFHVYETSSHPLFHLAHLISLWGWWGRDLCHCMPCNGKQGNRPSEFHWSSQGPIAWKWWHWRPSQQESPGYKFRALSTVLTLEVKGTFDILHPDNLLHSSLQRRLSWATMAACTWRSSCPWSCTPRQRTSPSASCPSELMGCWWLLPPGTLRTPCVWSWMGGVSSSWLT